MYLLVCWSAANQETVVELVSFLSRAIPEDLLYGRGDASTDQSETNTNTRHPQQKQVYL